MNALLWNRPFSRQLMKEKKGKIQFNDRLSLHVFVCVFFNRENAHDGHAER